MVGLAVEYICTVTVVSQTADKKVGNNTVNLHTAICSRGCVSGVRQPPDGDDPTTSATTDPARTASGGATDARGPATRPIRCASVSG